MKWIIRILVVVSASLACAALGWKVGEEVGVAWVRGDYQQWGRLPDPPKPARRIAAGSVREVVVEAADGSLYECRMPGEACWTSTEDTQVLEPDNQDCSQYPTNYQLSEPPQKAIDFLETYWCHFEVGAEIDYAVMQDGSVWMIYNQSSGLLGVAAILLAGPIGSGIGLIGGAIVSIVVLRYVVARQAVQQA